MLSSCPIRYKLLLGVAVLFLIVAILSLSGLQSTSSYRGLVKSLSRRAEELPLADQLVNKVSELRFELAQIRATHDFGDPTKTHPLGGQRFGSRLSDVRAALLAYQNQLEMVEPDSSGISDNRDEMEALGRLKASLERIEGLNNGQDWVFNKVPFDALQEELNRLHDLARGVPSHLADRLKKLRGNVRGDYHAFTALMWSTSILSVVLLSLLVKYFDHWVFRPLRVLIRGSRRVAAGDFDHRIQLGTHDEVAELAGAMNDMTSRFQEIRDGLDRQVKQRTKEVVRSEQLASVGFLAAGVAHEINNPLASIAWCAESLECRLHEVLYDQEESGDSGMPQQIDSEQLAVLRKYLRRIQEEAFRCKEITEGLLDFSRLGDVDKQDTDLKGLVADVIDMVRHLGKYRNKRIEFISDPTVLACVNSPEIKQVVLNLVTNALDSLDDQGVVQLRLRCQHDQAELLVRDDGCGMGDEVLEHVFEPFFTRRRDGQGTGLGLSISFRIVVDHGGRIEADSDGPGQGSQFRVTLPLIEQNEKHQRQRQAA